MAKLAVRCAGTSMTQIFVSHAVADKALAKLLTDFLKEAMGVPQKAIFVSSIPGHNIPLTTDFNDYIKEQIQEPDLVILLMTEAYMESWFCLMELGAAWAKSHRTLPIVVPPVRFSVVSSTLGLRQAWDITDSEGLNDLRALVREAVSDLESRSDHVWDEKRKKWIVDLKRARAKLATATVVSADDYAKLKTEVQQREEEVEALEAERENLEAQIAALESLKDPVEVRALKAAVPDVAGLRAEFDKLIEAVESARPTRTSDVVFHHIIMDHFGKAVPINGFGPDVDDFRQAMQYSLIDEGDQSVLWSRDKLKRVQKAIVDVVRFLQAEEGQKLAEAYPDENWDPDDREFWEQYI